MIDTLITRIRALSPVINEIVSVSGAPGASVGILNHGEIVHTEGFGFYDVANQLVPDENTIYYLASLSKTFTATMVAILVERGKLEWTTPVSAILPKFQHWDQTVQEQATIADFLSHRSGLTPRNNIWNMEFGQAALDRSEALPTVNSLEKLFELGKGFQYNNWGYAVADEVITALSGEFSWGTALQTNIFKPLGMTRTITSNKSILDNRVEPYMAFSNGKPHHLPIRPQFEDGEIMQGAVGVQSSVHDLLVYYKAMLEAFEDQTKNSKTTSEHSPLVQVPTLFKAQIPMFSLPSGNENSYAFGWARTELPAPLGSIGLNPTYVPEMPTVGKGIEKPTLCIWHQGSNMCSLHFVALLPETKTAIVVLSNGLANNDVSDWIGQLLLETVLDNPDKSDYLALAKLSAKNSNARWPKIKDDLERERTPNTSPKALSFYVGKYYNKLKNFHLEVRQAGETLELCFQGNHDFWYPMEHYENDIFTWVLTRDEDVRRGRFPVTWRAFYKIKFGSAPNGTITNLVWEHDGAWSAGETFHRQDAATDEKL